MNFEPKQIGKFMSEVLCLGFPDRNGNVVLLNIDRPALARRAAVLSLVRQTQLADAAADGVERS